MGCLSSAAKFFVVVLLSILAVVFLKHRADVPLVCYRPDLASFSREKACLFSADYWTSRARFVAASKRAGGNVTSLEVINGLTIDIAVFNEALCSEKMLLIHSGVHGVEGFAGAAIQLGVVRDIEKLKKNVCVVLTHGVNPYGFSELRRWNERGVDLNRNAMFQEREWKEVRERGDVAGYENFVEMFCPNNPPNMISSALSAVVLVARIGTRKLKRALVTGSYSRESCLFFGGKELQKSHQLLRDFYGKKGFLKTKKVFMIDVHTGLGPCGMDSLMASDLQSSAIISSLIEEVKPEPWPYSVESLSHKSIEGSASDGYEDTKGDCMVGYMSLFSNRTQKVAITQEFGTYPTVLVALALKNENDAFIHTEEARQKYSSHLSEVFNPYSQLYRESVVTRGETLVKLGLHYLHKK